MKNKLIILILIIGAALRVFFLSHHPAGFTPDEASFGYDAYSLLMTGKDQWGNDWPLVFKSFGDYKMPLYTYLAMPFVYVFGLSEMSVRLPNALLGVLAIFAVYLLVKESFNKKTALIASFLLAISPWHIPLSRGAFEANLTTFLMPIGMYFFIKGLKKPNLMAISGFFFGLNLFTYHSARLVTPFVVAALVFSNLKPIKDNCIKMFWGALVFGLFSIIGLITLFQGSAQRASTSTIFSTTDNLFNERVYSIASGEPLLIAKIFNNKATYLMNAFANNYVSYFSPEFLFINGAREGTYGMVQGMGVLFPFEVLALGALLIVLARKEKTLPLWLYVWLLAAPIPAAISVGPGHAANRAAVMMPAIQMISAIGIYILWEHFKKVRLAVLSIVALVVISFLVFAESYWFGQPAKEAKAMIYGSREVFEKVSLIENQYSKVIITKDISEPHIFVAFYSKLHPSMFQDSSKNWDFEDQNLKWVDQLPEYSLGKYTFKHINWHDDIKERDVLFVASPEIIPEGVNIIDKVHYPSGKPAYVILDNKAVEYAEAL